MPLGFQSAIRRRQGQSQQPFWARQQPQPTAPARPRPLPGTQDPRGLSGILSRGRNMYPGGNAAQSGGGPQYGRPLSPAIPESPLEAPRTSPRPSFRQQEPIFTGRPVGGFMPPPMPEPTATGQYTFPSARRQRVPWETFNPEYHSTLTSILRRQSELGSEEELGRRRLEEEYGERTRGLGRSREEALRSLAESMAERGLLRSGIYVGEQGEIGEQYQRGLGELAGMRSRGLEDMARQFAQARSGLEEERTGMERQRAAYESQESLSEAQEEAERQAIQEANARQNALLRQVAGLQGIAGTYMPQVQDIFQRWQAPIATDRENTQERLARLAGEASRGRPLSDIEQSVRGITGGQVRGLFQRYGVPIRTPQETESQRIARILEEIRRGRTIGDVETSIQGIARRMPRRPAVRGR